VEELAEREKAPVVILCGDLEAEMAELSSTERMNSCARWA